jgi:uncharacterized protein (TIGR00730 family)
VRSLCVFCGSSPGVRETYREAARAVGVAVAVRGWTLVYGGARVGLMGVVASAALQAGGRVVGVLPQVLGEREVVHDGLSELHLVGTMHERKARMAELADAFVALPGGLGTLEEIAEVATWSYLGIHDKPFGLLNVDGFYDGLLGFLDVAVTEGFIRPDTRARVLVEEEPTRMIERLGAAAAAIA